MTDIPEAVARAVFEGINADDPNAVEWDALSAEERDSERLLAEAYIAAHTGALAMAGARILPPNAVLKPTTQREALGMVKAAKDFMDADRRKGKLLDTAAAPSKLILPGRVN